MRVIGLTGSMAMGKSTTARLFSEEGVPVHDADATVHRLYAGAAASLIEAEFPGTTRDGVVDRPTLGRRVAAEPGALRRLEALVHPLVRQAEADFLRQAEAAGAPIAVLDIPLLFETRADGRVDAVVVVSAPPDVQRARVLERGVDPETFETLLARQMADAEKRQRADFIVDSAHGIEHARDQVRTILSAVAKMPVRRE